VFDLAPTEEQSTLIELVHGFAERELRRVAKEAEKARGVPDAVADALHALGVACPVPESLGGQGLPDLVTALMLAEELAWGDPGIAQAALAAGHVALLIASCGTPEQQQRWLPRFLEERPPAASLLYYEGFGRQPSELRTRAERAASGWRITGEKRGVPHPGTAALGVIVALRADTGALAAFVFEGALRGLRVIRDDRAEGKIGLGAAHTGDVALDGALLPDSALLGGSAADPLALARALAGLRLSVPAQALGCARAALEFARHYASERVAFGRPIAAFQGVAFPLVDQDMAVDAARIELWEIARAVAKSTDARQIERLTGAALARCCEAALTATRDALQTLGGHGFITEYPVERWYRSAAVLAAQDFDPGASTVSYL
jgi:alkylation response protein AidB-like acyl-CoA dehydrogenase